MIFNKLMFKRIICFCLVSLLILNGIHGQAVTYDVVRPIIDKKCAGCHHPGEAAPFSLLSYTDVAKRAKFIKDVISTNYMPPWRADVHYRDFANNRMLTAREKDLILQWVAQGLPKGKESEKKIPEENKNGEFITNYNRKPDAIIQIQKPFIVKGDNNERFISFKVPFDFGQENNVEAIEFYTNNKKIIHHVNYGFYDAPDSVSINDGDSVISIDDNREKLVQYEKYKRMIKYYTGWIPGASIESYPKNIGWAFPKRGIVLFTVHYSASSIDDTSTIGVNLFFRKDSIQRQVKIINFGSGGIGENDIVPPFAIPPNRVKTYSLTLQTSQDQSIMYLWPHMHYIGKEFFAYAIAPNGDTIKLIHIPKWDFRWQELYKPQKLIHIPAHSVLHIEGIYDNTTNNPFNPNNPPKFVYSTGDMSSKDEMLTLLMIYLPYRKGDENISLEQPIK
jgi:hypothetical protein